jgi:hypothetical protein
MSLVACGGSKPANDASGTPTAQDGTEPAKWDSSSTTNEPKKPAGATKLPDSAPKRKDSEYDKEQTDIVLARAAKQVKANCGEAKNEDGKAEGPWGKTKITVVLGHNGHTRSAQVGAPYEGKPVGRCMVQAFSNLTFPPWAGQDTTIEWDVEAVQPAAPAKPDKK